MPAPKRITAGHGIPRGPRVQPKVQSHELPKNTKVYQPGEKGYHGPQGDNQYRAQRWEDRAYRENSYARHDHRRDQNVLNSSKIGLGVTGGVAATGVAGGLVLHADGKRQARRIRQGQVAKGEFKAPFAEYDPLMRMGHKVHGAYNVTSMPKKVSSTDRALKWSNRHAEVITGAAAGLAGGAVAAGELSRERQIKRAKAARRRRQPIAKLAPSQRRSAEFNSGRTYERYAGETTRGRVTAEGAAAGGVAAAGAAGASSLSGAKLAGTPLGQAGLSAVERKLRAQHKLTRQKESPAFHAANQVARYKRYGQWAGNNRLKATGGILAAGGVAAGARIAQRVRQNEEAGISQGIGRMKAGEHYDRTATRVTKSAIHVAALASDLQAAGPRARKAATWALENRAKLTKYGLVGTGAVAAGTGGRVAYNHGHEAQNLRRELRQPVRKGGHAFLAAGALTGAGGLTASRELRSHGHEHASQQALAGTVGGWAGQGAYQAAGYVPKHIQLRRDAKMWAKNKGVPQPKPSKADPHPKPVWTKSKHQAEEKKHAERIGTTRGTPEFYRQYPKHLPGAKVHRVIGWTHRGSTGTALGSAATAVGGLAATKYVAGSAKGKKQPVHKSLYQREDRISPLRTAQLAGGLGLLAWGAGRSRFLGSALARGVKAAQGKNNAQAVEALQLAMAAQGALRRGTAPAERSLRQIRRINQAINAVPSAIRPEVAVAAGAVLAGRGTPIHRTTYQPVSQPVRLYRPAW